MIIPPDELRKKAISSLIWAAAQSWGSKILTFVLFIILARLISPAEFGVAAAAFLVLTILGIVAEFGFGDALIQKPDLQDEDVNLPFFVSMGLSIILAIIVAGHSHDIETLMGVQGLGDTVIAIAVLAPIFTAALFQEAMYRRHLMYKALALRTLFGTALGGVIAIAVAVLGGGVMALVVQMYVTTLVNLVWLWSRPVWTPSWKFIPDTFKSLAKFGSSIFGMRLLDFSAVRTADILVLTLFGPATLGLYTAGFKLLQVLMMLFQSVLSDVALTFLAKISHDRDRIVKLYLNTTTMSMAIISPIFVMLAALAPEISAILFGKKWAMVDHIVRPFLLLGAVQCVQYLNGAYFSAMGRPVYSFYLNIIKIVAIAPVFLLSKDEDVFLFVTLFCVAQTFVTIPSFYFLSRLLDIKLLDLGKRYLPFILSSLISFCTIIYAHPLFVMLINGTFIRGIILGIVFVCVYAVCILLLARKSALSVLNFLKNKGIA